MSDDETYEIPLQNQRAFGAGIKRTRVKFVPSTDSVTATAPSNTPAKSVSDLYLSLVLPSDEGTQHSNASATVPLDKSESVESQVCEICNLPLTSIAPSQIGSTDESEDRTKIRPHEASLAHQVCLQHSHPPSHLDRNRKGLTYLSAYGWDPDARLGLGASGQGIQFPIKTKPKDDKMGIGLVLPKEADRRKKVKTEKLDAGKVRKMHEKDKKKAETLREMFYRNDDVERYLGGG